MGSNNADTIRFDEIMSEIEDYEDTKVELLGPCRQSEFTLFTQMNKLQTIMLCE